MMADDALTHDVVIVGGGPAGLSAAIELKRLGVASVVVLERERVAGGIPRHCGHFPFGMREFARVLRGPDYAARLVERACRAGVDVRTQVTVTALQPGPSLAIATPDGTSTIAARRVLIATGVRETSRAARLIGGTKPGGVLSTGALQGLVYLDRKCPFRRPVVLGSELVSFSALLTCRHAGIEPAAMIEPNSRITAWSASALLPRLLGVPLLRDTTIERINGAAQVQSVDVKSGDGQIHTIETDGIVVTGQFVPEAALLRESHMGVDPASGGPAVDQFLRLSDPDYFAAGNLLRPVETAGWCFAEGRLAAGLIAKSLDGGLPNPMEDASVALVGDALKYVVPQRLSARGEVGGMRELQVRVKRPIRGTLTIVGDGRDLWSRKISALPERRILVPLPWSPALMQGKLQLVLTEDRA